MNASVRAKGLTHIDFIVAASVFILVFVIVVQVMTNFFTNAENAADVNALSGSALGLLSSIQAGPQPANWSGGELDRLGLASEAYRFEIVANNTQEHLLNQSANVTDIAAELVSFNYTDMGVAADPNSTAIYDEAGAQIPYHADGSRISFAFSIGNNQARFFTVYSDDDSNFTSNSAAVSGTSSINATFMPVRGFGVLQYRKIMTLNGTAYSTVRKSLNSTDFKIAISGAATGNAFFVYGGNVPRRGNVVALQSYGVFQNSTAGINGGKIIVQTW